MNYKEQYNQWMNSSSLDEEAKNELQSIADNEEEIQDRFYKDLEFGTAGLRGKIGMGTNRMNIYTVGKSTQGLASYLLENVENAQRRGVVIAYDCRYKSREFSERAARILTANGIKVYLFEDIRPTPELSFAVTELGAAAGIVVTASHNPPDYNGYKVYSENAAQILPEVADKIIEQIDMIKDYSKIQIISLEEAHEKGLFELIGKELDRIYYQKVKELSLSEDLDKEINIVYTPLHGTGNIPIRTILKEMGYENVFVDEEQAKPDPEFSTVDSPNPENSEAFERAVKLGKEVNADILIATDPDCDRIAVAVSSTHSHYEERSDEAISSPDARNNYLFLNGNQTGALLLNYILSRRKENKQLPKEGFNIKTIVTSELGRVVADSYDITTYDTLTGFKFICNKAMELEKEGGTFLFGYEESIGYLAGNFVRDKDAVISALIIAEMSAYYKKKRLTLVDVLNKLYEKHGYFLEHLESIYLEGMEGEQQMEKIMTAFRGKFPEIPEMHISRKIDYKTSFQYDYEAQKEEIVAIPKSDVLKCIFSDGSWYAVRPSGTEPKIKIYMSLVGKDKAEAEEKLGKLKSVIFGKINSIIK
ncbi:MAG: phospho-sugar mutase [Promethearchaeia archaeon]